MNKILLILLGVAVSLTASAAAPALQSADRGEVHRHYLWSPQMGDTITVDVWTPEGYSAKGKPYPVIYGIIRPGSWIPSYRCCRTATL